MHNQFSGNNSLYKAILLLVSAYQLNPLPGTFAQLYNIIISLCTRSLLLSPDVNIPLVSPFFGFCACLSSKPKPRNPTPAAYSETKLTVHTLIAA